MTGLTGIVSLGVIGASGPEFQGNVAHQVWRLDHGLQVRN